MQWTLLITIALVVMVIFIFLRHLWATVIPSITVPLALIGTFAIMYVLGYSLDNLSLMALTISVGFVVDDAIVMIENIVRYIEKGLTPFEAAHQGRRADRRSRSHIHYFLVDRGVHSRSFSWVGLLAACSMSLRSAVTIAVMVSAFVSLTLTPVMCSLFLESGGRAHGQWAA